MPTLSPDRQAGTPTPRTAAGRRCAGVLCIAAWLLAVLPGAAHSATAAELAGPASDPHVAAERERLARENAILLRRLDALEAQQGLAERLDQQASRLAGLAERLEERLDGAEGTGNRAAGGADPHLEALGRDLAEAKRQRYEADARADKLAARVAELEARLKQQQLTVDEALMRADKAEKLHAALEEAHARMRTENERLSIELGNAKERQAEALQRVVELDSRLQVTAARAGAAATAAALISDLPPEPAALAVPDAQAIARTTVVYEVRDADTLSRIAAKVYGDAGAWRRIFDANRDLLDGPDDLALGMRLIIP